MCVSGPVTTLVDDESGASAVEFALVLPIFIVMVFGIFQFGMAQHRLSSIRYALNAVSREVMLNPTLTEAQVSFKVKDRLNKVADSNVTVTMAKISSASGQVARLTGVYATEVGIPTLAAFPIAVRTTVDVALPET